MRVTDGFRYFRRRVRFNEVPRGASDAEGGQRRERDIFFEEHEPPSIYTAWQTKVNVVCRPVSPATIESKIIQRGKSVMPMYPEIMVIPMREELTRLGVEELRQPDHVDQALKDRPGTTMVVVNSICGCAAGRMRPAVRLAMENSVRPDRSYSVFAGQDKEATDRARSYFTGQLPSSPSIAILRDGQLVYMMPRRDIESREAPAIAADLKAAFDRFCVKAAEVK